MAGAVCARHPASAGAAGVAAGGMEGGAGEGGCPHAKALHV